MLPMDCQCLLRDYGHINGLIYVHVHKERYSHTQRKQEMVFIGFKHNTLRCNIGLLPGDYLLHAQATDPLMSLTSTYIEIGL
jgi:hypothetical protein